MKFVYEFFVFYLNICVEGYYNLWSCAPAKLVSFTGCKSTASDTV